MSSTPPPEDLAARGRAIFERLRGAAKRASSDGEPLDGPDPTESSAVTPPTVAADDDGDAAARDGEGAEGSAAISADATGDGAAPVDVAGTASAVDTPTPDHRATGVEQAGGALVDQSNAEPLASPTGSVAGIADPASSIAEPSAPVMAAAPVVDDVQAPEAGPDERAERTVQLRPLPRVMAIANQKGGVGKTTTAVNLGACLAELGHQVLVVDLDPQGNASTGLGINIRGLEASMYEVILQDVPLEDTIEAASLRNLFVAPASLDLAGAEIELVPAFSRELRLRRAVDAVRDDYDFILIDCPPSLGLLTVNGLAAADEVLVPIQCEYYALEGLGQLLRNVQLVQKNLNDDLDISTIVLVMYDARTKLADQVMREVRNHFGDTVCRTVIPRTVRLSEAPSFGQPIVAFDPGSRGAVAYRELAREVSSASQRVG